MGQVTRFTCDGGCGRETENYNSLPGWVRLDGSLTRAWGVYESNSFKSDYLDKRDRHFCSIECMIRLLDRMRTEANGPTPNVGGQPRCNTRSELRTWCQHDDGHVGRHRDAACNEWPMPTPETESQTDTDPGDTSWRRIMVPDDEAASA